MAKLTKEERETTTTYTMSDSVVLIYSCIAGDIAALKRNGLTPVNEGEYNEGTAWAEFKVPKELFSIGRAIRKPRQLSPDHIKAMQTARFSKVI